MLLLRGARTASSLGNIATCLLTCSGYPHIRQKSVQVAPNPDFPESLAAIETLSSPRSEREIVTLPAVRLPRRRHRR
jgi:hypothetical protein